MKQFYHYENKYALYPQQKCKTNLYSENKIKSSYAHLTVRSMTSYVKSSNTIHMTDPSEKTTDSLVVITKASACLSVSHYYVKYTENMLNMFWSVINRIKCIVFNTILQSC